AHGLIRSVRSGYLELAATQFMNEGDQANALSQWTEDLVWVKAKSFVLKPDQPVPLVSSPNLLLPDRLGMAALETANRPYEIVFTAFDTLARRAAAAAGLGYFAVPRSGGCQTRRDAGAGSLPRLPARYLGARCRD